MNDRIPYTYLIGWSSLNKFYYGVRWAKGCNPSDFWQSYFTSSDHVKMFREIHGEPDIIQVRKTFDNKHQAILWEHSVITRLNLERRDDFLNKKAFDFGGNQCDPTGTKWFNDGTVSVRAYSCPDGFVPGRITFTRGAHSQETIEKIRKSNTGRNISEETKKKHSENGKKNRWWNNGELSKFCPERPDGFVPGRLRWKDPKPKRSLTRFSSVTCPHCGKEGGKNAMMRYHFDNCKEL